ncbi:hypothetical protein EVAR_101977_1 [Eumeta japonica]|uniref:PHD-type domain-containing protein n=1 Tax=Eumeta variegata TaxID=151549 RepID=A0A4C1TSK7_EUMVA|nr:hypothetical protein EVAR_101977_1 [Eumeta japonica]
MVFYPALIRRTHCRILMRPRYCKICRKKVNKKNGAQCEGNCKKWVHYSCINVPFDIMENVKNEAIEEVNDSLAKSQDCDQVKGDIEAVPTSTVSYVESLPDFHSAAPLQRTCTQSNCDRRCGSITTTSDPATDTSQSRICMCYTASTTPSLPSSRNDSVYQMVPMHCDINEVCYTAKEISKGMENLMNTFKSVLRHHEKKYLSNKRCSKCNKERTTSDESEEN